MFSNWDSWDVALATIAAYIAVTSLVRLMQREREQLVARFRGEVQAEQRRQALLAMQKPQTKPAREAA